MTAKILNPFDIPVYPSSKACRYEFNFPTRKESTFDYIPGKSIETNCSKENMVQPKHLNLLKMLKKYMYEIIEESCFDIKSFNNISNGKRACNEVFYNLEDTIINDSRMNIKNKILQSNENV